MKWLVDMPLSPSLARWLSEQGHDAVHAAELNLHQAFDINLMEQAVAQSRAVVTADLDYPRLLAISRAVGPALVLFRGGNYSEAETIELMKRVLDRISEPDLRRSIVVVQKGRIRRRELPLD